MLIDFFIIIIKYEFDKNTDGTGYTKSFLE